MALTNIDDYNTAQETFNILRKALDQLNLAYSIEFDTTIGDIIYDLEDEIEKLEDDIEEFRSKVKLYRVETEPCN